jgi:glycosyltransferase involved in cell wall biosynthesis
MDLEIIVVNDGSTQEDYYNYDFGEFVNIIHLSENSKTVFGFNHPGYVRNEGIKKTKGNYVAFCDDDDMWFPKKIELQLRAMKKTGCKMSATDGLIGGGVYDSKKMYKKFISEHFDNTLRAIYREKGKDSLLKNGFPDVWDYEFLSVHNCVVCSSVVIEKAILDKIDNFNNLKPPPGEDYDCWMRALRHTNIAYIKDVCFYYDDNHGDGAVWGR